MKALKTAFSFKFMGMSGGVAVQRKFHRTFYYFLFPGRSNPSRSRREGFALASFRPAIISVLKDICDEAYFCMRLFAVFGLSLSGCGTFSNRGGFVDRLEDTFWFRADTKQHRVLRSYLLLASMARLATRSNTSQDEREALAVRIGKAVRIADDAFRCAYRSQPCAFFDDRMAALDIMLLQLAAGIFASEEDQGLIQQLGNELLGKTPINDVIASLTHGRS